MLHKVVVLVRELGHGRRGPLVEVTTVTVVPDTRNRNSGPGWISYSKEGIFFTNFNITTLEFIFSH